MAHFIYMQMIIGWETESIPVFKLFCQEIFKSCIKKDFWSRPPVDNITGNRILSWQATTRSWVGLCQESKDWVDRRGRLGCESCYLHDVRTEPDFTKGFKCSGREGHVNGCGNVAKLRCRTVQGTSEILVCEIVGSTFRGPWGCLVYPPKSLLMHYNMSSSQIRCITDEYKDKEFPWPNTPYKTSGNLPALN